MQKYHPKEFRIRFLPRHKGVDNRELKNPTFYPRTTERLSADQYLTLT